MPGSEVDNLMGYDATITKLLDGVIKAKPENKINLLNELFKNGAFLKLIRESETTFNQVLNILLLPEFNLLKPSNKDTGSIESSITIVYDDPNSNATYAFYRNDQDLLFYRVSEQDKFATLAEQPDMTFDQFSRFLYKSIINKLGDIPEATLSFDAYKVPTM
ncbi:MAG: hypothetical protein ABIM99_03100 [Candidatus Dojkabacteria bacterium]